MKRSAPWATADFLENHVRPRAAADAANTTTTDRSATDLLSREDAMHTPSYNNRGSRRRKYDEHVGGGSSDDGRRSALPGGAGVSVAGAEKNNETKNKKTGYLAQHALFEQIPALLRDVDLPDYCALSQDADAEEGGVKAINAWLGPEGTVSPLHSDPHHNLLSQAVGRKYVRLYAPAHAPALYPHEEPKMRNSSRVDLRRSPARLAAEGFPLFPAAPYADCVLTPGEMLYIPPGWFHYVQSLSGSFSVSFWWR